MCYLASALQLMYIHDLFSHFLQCSVAVTSIACRDGTTLVSGSEDGIIRIWDIMTQHVVRVLKHAKGSDTDSLLYLHILFLKNFA